jgi:general secretion pathway protein G
MKNMKSGFTLVEIMIVVAIIGLLAGMGTLAVMKAVNNSRIKTAETELQLISSGVLQLAWDTGKWPNGAVRSEGVGSRNEMRNLDGSVLFQLRDEDSFPDWKGPYYEGSLVDPWGKAYFFDSDYRVDGVDRIVVGSHGPNRSGINRYDEDNIYIFLDY